MTHDEIDQRLLEAFDKPFLGAAARCSVGELTLREAEDHLYFELKLPPRVKKKKFPDRRTWARQEARWSFKRLEQQGLIEQIAEDKWRKLSLLEQLARVTVNKKRRKS